MIFQNVECILYLLKYCLNFNLRSLICKLCEFFNQPIVFGFDLELFSIFIFPLVHLTCKGHPPCLGLVAWVRRLRCPLVRVALLINMVKCQAMTFKTY